MLGSTTFLIHGTNSMLFYKDKYILSNLFTTNYMNPEIF